MPILTQLLGVTDTACRRTVTKLVGSGELKTEQLVVGSQKLTLVGISQYGLDKVGGKGRYFSLGKTNPSYVSHHLDTQRARLFAEARGGKNWITAKTLDAGKFKKVPDAVFSAPTIKKVMVEGVETKVPGEKRIAVEIERFIKTPSRYAVDIANHLHEIAEKRWREVHYILAPEDVQAILRTWSRIDFILVDGKKEPLTAKHLSFFKFSSLADWKF